MRGTNFSKITFACSMHEYPHKKKQINFENALGVDLYTFRNFLAVNAFYKYIALSYVHY